MCKNVRHSFGFAWNVECEFMCVCVDSINQHSNRKVKTSILYELKI